MSIETKTIEIDKTTNPKFPKKSAYTFPYWIDRRYHNQLRTNEQFYEALLVRHLYFHPKRIDNYDKEELLTKLYSIVKFEESFPHDVYPLYEDSTFLEQKCPAELIKGKDAAFISDLVTNDPRIDDIQLEDFLEPELDIGNPKEYTDHYARLRAFNTQSLSEKTLFELYKLDEPDDSGEIDTFEKPIYVKISPSSDSASINKSITKIMNDYNKKRGRFNFTLEQFLNVCKETHALLYFDLSIWCKLKNIKVKSKSYWNDIMYWKELEIDPDYNNEAYRTTMKNAKLLMEESILLQLHKQIINSPE